MSNYRINKLFIIDAGLSIEAVLERCISLFLFNPKSDANRKRSFFEINILNSNWCSFASKKKLLKMIISGFEEYDGKSVNDIDKMLTKVMAIRNANVHGQYVVQSDGLVFQKYSDSNGKEAIQELNDKYFEDTSSLFINCLEAINTIESLIIRKYLPADQ